MTTAIQRKAIEKKIARTAIATFLNAGYAMSVFNGDETTIEKSTDAAAIFDHMFKTDSVTLYVSRPGMQIIDYGWVDFIYGNDGWDVIADCSVGLSATAKSIVDGVCAELSGEVAA